MSTRTSPWKTGIPCWVNLGTPDVRTAEFFYGSVLGWTFQGPEDKSNSIAQSNGSTAAGLGTGIPDTKSAWTLFFATDDIGKLEAAVSQNGGNVVHSTRDVGELGRMFVATDPTGAEFGAWQAGTHIGAGVVNEVGALVWEDLRSTDPDRARTFYSSVFDYSYDPVPMAGPDYTTFALPGEGVPAGGMGGLMGNELSPSHWLVYFAVADTDAAVAAVETNNGSVQMPAIDSPFGRIAVVADHAGAQFAMIQPLANAPFPDREG